MISFNSVMKQNDFSISHWVKNNEDKANVLCIFLSSPISVNVAFYYSSSHLQGFFFPIGWWQDNQAILHKVKALHCWGEIFQSIWDHLWPFVFQLQCPRNGVVSVRQWTTQLEKQSFDALINAEWCLSLISVRNIMWNIILSDKTNSQND